MLRTLMFTTALLTTSTAFAAAPDLSIETLFAFDAGEVEVTVHVENVGDATAPGVWVDLYGSKGAQWKDDSQNTHYDEFVDALAPGHDDKVVFVLTAQEWEDNGFVFATVDVENRIAEQDETNNLAKLAVLDWSSNEPALACGTSSWVPAPLKQAPFMTFAFLQSNMPFLYCKSRAL